MEIEYYTLKQVAEILSVSTSTARRMLNDGDLPVGVQIGKRTVWPKAGFIAWLSSLGFETGSEQKAA